jgi:hypothetical protein
VRVWVSLEFPIGQALDVYFYGKSLPVALYQDGVIDSEKVLVEVRAGLFAASALAVPPRSQEITR